MSLLAKQKVLQSFDRRGLWTRLFLGGIAALFFVFFAFQFALSEELTSATEKLDTLAEKLDFIVQTERGTSDIDVRVTKTVTVEDAMAKHNVRSTTWSPHPSVRPISWYTVEAFKLALEANLGLHKPLSLAEFAAMKITRKMAREARATLEVFYKQKGLEINNRGRTILAEIGYLQRYIRKPTYRMGLRGFYNEYLAKIIERKGSVSGWRVTPKKEKVFRENERGQKVPVGELYVYEAATESGEKIRYEIDKYTTDKLMDFKPSVYMAKHFGKSAVVEKPWEALKSLPTEAFLFYLANNIIAVFEHLYDARANPHLIQDMLGMFNSVEEIFHFYTFVLGARYGSRLMEIAFAKTNLSPKMPHLTRAIVNYLGLAAGFSVSEMIADFMGQAKNCHLGYISTHRYANLQEMKVHQDNCDLAYSRFIRGRWLQNFMADGMTLVMAAMAASFTQLGVQRLAIGRLIMSAGNLFFGLGGPVGRLAHFIMFIVYHKLINAVILPRFKSYTKSLNLDRSEDKLMAKMKKFREDGWKLERKVSNEDCGSFLYRTVTGNNSSEGYNINGEDLTYCFEGTVVEDIRNAADDHKIWRQFIMEKPNEKYQVYMTDSKEFVNQVESTKIVYEDVIDQIEKDTTFVNMSKTMYGNIWGVTDAQFEMETPAGRVLQTKQDAKVLVEPFEVSFKDHYPAQINNLKWQASKIDYWLDNWDKFNFFLSKKPNGGEMSVDVFKSRYVPRISRILKQVKKSLTSTDPEEFWGMISYVKDYSDKYKGECTAVDVLNTVGETEEDQATLRTIEEFYDKMKDEELSLKELAEMQTGFLNSVSEEEIEQLNVEVEIMRNDYFEREFKIECFFHDIYLSLGAPESRGQLYDIYLNRLNRKLAEEHIDFGKGYIEFRGQRIGFTNPVETIIYDAACGLKSMKNVTPFEVYYQPGEEKGFFAWLWPNRDGEWDEKKGTVKDTWGFALSFRSPRIIDADDPVCDQKTIFINDEGEVKDYLVLNGDLQIKEWRQQPDIKIEGRRVNLLEYLKEKTFLKTVSEFKTWWDKYIKFDFTEAIHKLHVDYNELLKTYFYPAIFGYRDNIEKIKDELKCEKKFHSSTLNSDSFVLKYNYGLAMGEFLFDFAAATGDAIAETIYESMIRSPDENGYYHQFPPRYFPREEVRTCDWSRRKYVPVIAAYRLELELYIDYVLKPIYDSMYESKKFGSEAHKRQAKKVFDLKRQQILNLFEILLTYTPDEAGNVATKNVPAKVKYLSAAIQGLKASFGMAPADPQEVAEVMDLISPEDAKDAYDVWKAELAYFEDLQRQAQQIPMYSSEWFEKFGDFATILPGQKPLQTPKPWHSLTHDQIIVVSEVIGHMKAMVFEATSIARLIEDVDFEFER